MQLVGWARRIEKGRKISGFGTTLTLKRAGPVKLIEEPLILACHGMPWYGRTCKSGSKREVNETLTKLGRGWTSGKQDRDGRPSKAAAVDDVLYVWFHRHRLSAKTG